MTKSVTGKSWQQKILKEHYVLELCRKLEITDLLAQILSSRTSELSEADNFLSPKIRNLLPDPYHLLDMEKAINRAVNAIINKQKIVIFADYDVDGATSAALLKNLLRDIGHDATIYVPDRINEGYGPTSLAMQKLKEAEAELVITVDCGTMAYEALEYAEKVGLEVIVIDHHISADSLPKAVAVINPNRLDETSEYTYLAAVGVSFLFATALVSQLKKQNYFNSAPCPNLMNYLDLVALGTVCDVMPIIKLNRAFVTQGLKIIQKKCNLGLNALLNVAIIEEKPSCYHLGYVIGPRINAGGRVGKSSLGANLLSSICEIEAKQLAQELDKHNNERKVIEQLMFDEAIIIAESQKNASCLIIAKEGWHPGVIGIIAGRLKEKFNKPVAVIALNDGIGKASCRSIKGIDFGNKIFAAKSHNLVINGGGHAMAAGFTMLEDKLVELQDFLGKLFADDLSKLINYGVEEYESDLTTSSINLEFINNLSRLEPYGAANPEPIFKFAGLFVLKADIVAGKHIKCLLAPSRETYGSKPISAIAFNAIGSELEKFLLNSKPYSIDVIGSLKINNWQGRELIQLQIKDLIISS